MTLTSLYHSLGTTKVPAEAVLSFVLYTHSLLGSLSNEFKIKLAYLQKKKFPSSPEEVLIFLIAVSGNQFYFKCRRIC